MMLSCWKAEEIDPGHIYIWVGLTQEDTLRGSNQPPPGNGSSMGGGSPAVAERLADLQGQSQRGDFIYLFFLLKILELFLPEIRGLGAGKPIMHLQI